MKRTDPTPGGVELLSEAKALGLNITYTNLTGGKLVIQWKDANGRTQWFHKRGRVDRRAYCGERRMTCNTILALLAELDACKKDAARYRWLRNNADFQIEYTGALTLDQHIDAAMGEK